MSNFTFLLAEWKDLHEAAARAEAAALPDPRTGCFYARRALELMLQWLYTHDPAFKSPYESSLSALLHEPSFKNAAGHTVFTKASLVKKLGNNAVHSNRAIPPKDGLIATRELFHVLFWFARTYSKGAKPPDSLQFSPVALPQTSPIPTQTKKQLADLEAQLAARDAQLNELLTGKQDLDSQLEALRAEIAEIKKKNADTPDQHDYSEAETRDLFIDVLLKEAGWGLDQERDREFPVTGMPNEKGDGFVDYVLWGDDDKPLALIEAKRTKKNATRGQQQAKLYADCLEKQFSRRPVIFYSNGYDHWLWDDTAYPPRPVQGFLKKDELELLIQRRETKKALGETKIDEQIVERYYQTRAIRRIGEAFEKDCSRKALVVMATGAGKTRTVIALCDLLMRANWVKRVLFLADRVALVRQAVGAFKKHLPGSSPVNLVTEKDGEGRVFVSTYPTMMGLIDETNDEGRRFGVGHFDLVIIDEAHRSVYQKYRAIFEYFDSLLVGLTATPKDEVDRNTYSLFDLQSGVPTDVYGLDEAVKDGYLVPPESIVVPMKFQRQGIKYSELSEEEKDQWDALEWNEDGRVPDHVEAEAVNKWLFNKDTVDKVLEHLITRGLKVANGDRLGKTIIFAKNHNHAEFIGERFNANYPHYKGDFARVIDFQVEYVQNLIDNFSQAQKSPHIAISVDMLDTGIDIPEVVNLVFFKLVRSKTKFWQMVGRGTRLCPDLFGPSKDKSCFYLFDYCQNLEYFSQDPATTEGTIQESLGTKLFKTRVELIAEVDRALGSAKPDDHLGEVRKDTAVRLREEVAAMNIDNFIVRPKRKYVETYSKAESWKSLGIEQQSELVEHVAGLPSELVDDDQEAKQFDLLMLRLELALLRVDRTFTRMQEQVKKIAALLEEKSAIPMVHQQMELILEIQTDDYWQDMTVPILEIARKRLRALVKFIDKSGRQRVYSDFEDLMGEEVQVVLPGFGAGDYERFRAKTRQFLKQHQNDGPIYKLRWNEPLTAADLQELEQMLTNAAAGSHDHLAKAISEHNGLGLFVRSLVGLDRQAAKRALDDFLSGKTLSATQIDFTNVVIEHLTMRGWMDPALLYESPFTDYSPSGVEGVFKAPEVIQLVAALSDVRVRAAVQG